MKMDLALDHSRVFLKDSLDLSDLIADGTTFEINTDFEDSAPSFMDDFNIDSDKEGSEDNEDYEPELSPWTQSFDKLKKEMIAVNEHMHKRIMRTGKVDKPIVPENARVHVRYSAYFEGDTAPYDSIPLRGKKFYFTTGNQEVLEGLECAVRTMHVKEEAQFIISYKVLHGELGCPPRIKPKAESLYVIEVLGYEEVGDLNADQNVPAEDRNKYSKMIEELKKIHLKGLDFFKHGDNRLAARSFEKVVDCLNFCILANEQEQQEQEELLIKANTNLLVCYNNLNQPGKTCIAMKSIRRLTNNQPPCKALFHEGRALHLLGDYDRSRAILLKAHKMEPMNLKINNELKLLDQMCSKYNSSIKNMWTKALGIIDNKGNGSKKNEQDSNEYVDSITSLLTEFKNMNLNEMDLPPGLTAQELDSIGDTAKKMNIKLRVMHGDKNIYSLVKMD